MRDLLIDDKSSQHGKLIFTPKLIRTFIESCVISTGVIRLRADKRCKRSRACCSTAMTNASWTVLQSSPAGANEMRRGKSTRRKIAFYYSTGYRARYELRSINLTILLLLLLLRLSFNWHKHTHTHIYTCWRCTRNEKVPRLSVFDGAIFM